MSNYPPTLWSGRACGIQAKNLSSIPWQYQYHNNINLLFSFSQKHFINTMTLSISWHISYPKYTQPTLYWHSTPNVLNYCISFGARGQKVQWLPFPWVGILRIHPKMTYFLSKIHKSYCVLTQCSKCTKLPQFLPRARPKSAVAPISLGGHSQNTSQNDIFPIQNTQILLCTNKMLQMY